MEFFSNIDPLYRSYGKQEALQRQKTYFGAASVERNWLDYNAEFANGSNWMKHAGSPFGDPLRNEKNQNRFTITRGRENSRLHDRWREARAHSHSFGDPTHPFVYRGEGKAYTYKLFLEQSHALCDANGRMGIIVPSGLYSDKGGSALRTLFLDHCRWEWLFSIENRDKIFPIHRSYKFNPIIVEKNGVTEAISTAFMQRKLEDWEYAENFATPYTRTQVERFSPKSRAILEIRSQRDLEILEKIYADAVLLSDDGPNGSCIRYSQGDINLTSDSQLSGLAHSGRPRATGPMNTTDGCWATGDPLRESGMLWASIRPVPNRYRFSWKSGCSIRLPIPNAGRSRRDSFAVICLSPVMSPAPIGVCAAPSLLTTGCRYRERRFQPV